MDKMEQKHVTRFKCFWAWQDEKEEAWLSTMAAEGLHLDKPLFPCFYRFEVGEPAEIVYRLDYPVLKNKDRASYLQLFEDAGWEHAGDMVGWVYFRRAVKQGEPIEIYSDAESKIQKYRRLMAYLTIFLPILVVISPDLDSEYFGKIGPLIFIIWFVILLLWFAAMINLWRRINQLRDSK
jgi:hypothetical protein